ncbi:uncharacterized protein A4U43_C05F9580 [Asparagus officinalis]|uniref:RING-type domain-containing protein n=1 Tax=Asparagus officinalis TaxID=4686 RepID=A0A5P1EQK1_ASPOF|nr:uncharacterized protein LOC109842706 [Asparagus officinalis]ONK68278.1 uncharacterized protein A4U43_C05F9580 [Asparagus officinalis]
MSYGRLALTLSPHNLSRGNQYESAHDDDYNQSHSHYFMPLPLLYQPEDGGGLYTPWRLFEERVRSGPYGLASFPSQPYSPIRILILGPGAQEQVNPRLRQFIQDSPPRIRNDWHLSFPQNEPDEPGLTENEFKKAMKKLRKGVYNPTHPRKKSWTQGLFSTKSVTKKKIEEEKSEGKSCNVCLEDFVLNERVLITPCNHMFHNDCLVPWVRSHGKCPVCRFSLCEQRERALATNRSYDNDNGIVRGGVADVDLVSLIRAMEEALNWVHVPQ